MHERTLETKVVSDQLDRKKKVTDAFTGKLPALLDRLETSIIGGDPRVKSATATTIEFLKKLAPEKLQALVADDMPFLSSEEKDLLRKLLDSVGIPRTAPVAQPTEEKPPEEPKKEES